MGSSIRPNRTEVSRNFPVLGFTIRTSRSPAWCDVALATDPALLRADGSGRRTPQNFFATSGSAPIPVLGGDTVWLVPDEALGRLSAGNLVYFGLATFSTPARAEPEIWIPDPAAASSVAISESYRMVRRPALVGARSPSSDYGNSAALTWAGDAPTPGAEHVATPDGSANGASMNGHVPAATIDATQSFVYDDGLGIDFWSSPQAVALSGQSFDVRHDDVLLIPQPTSMSCWAASAAMVVAWRMRLGSVDPLLIAAGAGEWAAYTNGLDVDHNDELAAAWQLTAEAPMCYSVDGLRQLIESCGPLWIGVAVPSGHAVVITGIYGDGTTEGTYIVYHDPWPPGVGAANAVKRFDTFMQEYEDRATTDAAGNANVQILHADGRRIPLSTATTHATGVNPDDIGIEEAVPASMTDPTARSVALGHSVRKSIGFEGEQPDYPQASRFTAAGSGHYTPQDSRTVDRIVLHITDGGPSVNGTIRWFQLPENHPDFKPVSSHYIVAQDGEVVQMVRHHDIAHHARGANSTSIGIEHVANTRGLAYTEAQYAASSALVRWLCDEVGIPCDRAHVLGHREAAVTTKTCPGDFDWDYVMSMATRGQCFARNDLPPEDIGRWTAPLATTQAVPAAAVVEIASTIVGAAMERLLDNSGDISWELDQLKGVKHPGDDPANSGNGTWRDAPVLTLGKFTSGGLIDEISATFEVRYQYNGRSLANVRVINTGTNDAIGWGLDVKAVIDDDKVTYQRNGGDPFAAVKLTVTYRFTRSIGSDVIGVRDLWLYGDGSFFETSAWKQQ